MVNPVVKLAEHIDEVCGLHNTGGVASFFDENGELRACQPGENIFAFNIACSINIYDPAEHDDFKMNVWNNLNGDISGLNAAQEAIDSFEMPELDDRELVTIYEGNPTFEDLHAEIDDKQDFCNNISVYDAEADEYYPVTAVARAGCGNDVLDPGHLVLVIKHG